MKTIYYKSYLLISWMFLLPSFGGAGGGLYAQDPELFEHTWYLLDLVVGGTSNTPPINNEIPFVPADFSENGTLSTGMCENTGSGELEYIGTDEFLVLEMVFLQGECFQNPPFNQDYSNLYQNFWSPLAGSGIIAYEIIENGNTLILIITSPNGDFAVYHDEVPLSMNVFSNFGFMIYPNPVKESLQIKNPYNLSVNAIIYNIDGKKVQTHFLENDLSKIDVKALNQGLYFVVFENENGERVSKKFIKY